jgi:hypothetical protein
MEIRYWQSHELHAGSFLLAGFGCLLCRFALRVVCSALALAPADFEEKTEKLPAVRCFLLARQTGRLNLVRYLRFAAAQEAHQAVLRTLRILTGHLGGRDLTERLLPQLAARQRVLGELPADEETETPDAEERPPLGHERPLGTEVDGKTVPARCCEWLSHQPRSEGRAPALCRAVWTARKDQVELGLIEGESRRLVYPGLDDSQDRRLLGLEPEGSHGGQSVGSGLELVAGRCLV